MIFWFKKSKQSIFSKLIRYLDQLDVCKNEFITSITDLINRKSYERDKTLMATVHKAESQADDLRRDIEYELYNKALIPELRGDVLGIMETADTIPSCFQSICYQVYLQRIEFPDEFIPFFHKLIQININAYDLLHKAIRGFFENKKIFEEIQEIDFTESESDRLERELIEKIFLSNLDKADKILLKEIVIGIGNI